MKRIPLNWLQAFEAAGRSGSFKAAAEELSVSPSNVSHQIRDLEARLGVLLFGRAGGGVTLTEEGRRFLEPLSEGFRHLHDAPLQVHPGAAGLHVGTFPFLASEVVTPRLDALKVLLPDTEIRLFTQTNLKLLSAVDRARRLDVVVTYGPADGRFPGLLSQALADVTVVPVQAAGAAPIESVADLLAQPLIHVLGPFQGWVRWRERFCPEAEFPDFVLETDNFHAAMLAVERGDGVCLGVLPQLRPWLRAGRVRATHPLSLPVEDQSAFAVRAPYQADNPAIDAFVDWLRGQLT